MTASDGGEGAIPLPPMPSSASATTKRQLNSSNSQALGQREVPIVELKLENVTYSPVTASAGGQRKNRTKRCCSAAGLCRSPPPNVDDNQPSLSRRTDVLKNVSTCISPYKLTAVMGPSGSGKTSMISVAADLTKPDDLSKQSQISVNGEKGRIPKRLVGVVWQDDLLLSNLTVEENIYYAARLKTHETTSNNDVRHFVEETMKELGLLHVRNSLVGSPLSVSVRGVSGGERKRVSVASELVVRPSLLLLDEPTSGLDATTAQALIETLKDLALMGHSVAVVIHQPRTTIYRLFDHLLLLSRGRVIFDGEPCKAREYLEACPSVGELPPETGIADWIMDMITADENRQDETGSKSVLAERWIECSENERCSRQLSLRKSSRHSSRRMSSLEELHAVPKFNVSFTTQLRLLTRRTLKQQRGERLTATSVLLQFAYLFFTALFWWRMPDNTGWIFERTSLLFFMLIAQSNGIVISSVTIFQQEKALLRRERAKKMYGVAPYFLAKVISDMTNNVLLPLLYGMIVYWTANFRPTFIAYLKFILSFYLTLSTAQAMGLFLSIAIPNTRASLVLAPPITLFFMIMGGFYIPFENMHPGVEWLSWLSFARYGYSALVINEFSGRPVSCESPGGGVDISDTTSVLPSGGDGWMCPVSGDEVVAGMGIEGVANIFWFNVIMVTVLQLVFRILAYVLLRRHK